MSMNYNLKWFFENIEIELDAAKFLQKEIIPANKKCRRKHDMAFKEKDGNVQWSCSKSACDQKRISVRKDTWLEGSTIPLKKIILFIYSWAKDYTTIDFCIQELGISKDTAVDFNNYLREVS